MNNNKNNNNTNLTMHYQFTLYNAENTFLKELCQYVLDKCRQWNNLARHPLTVPPPSAGRRRQSWAKLRLRASSFAKLRLNFELRSADNAPQCSPPQSASPLPSLNSSINEHEEQQPMNTSANRGVKVKKSRGAQTAGPKRPAPADTAQSASPLPSLSSSINEREEQKQQQPIMNSRHNSVIRKVNQTKLASFRSSPYAEQLNAFTGPNNNTNNNVGGGGLLSLSVPKQQNFYAIEKAFHDCVFASVPGSITAGNTQPPTSSSSTLATAAAAAAVGTNSTSVVVPSTSMQSAAVGGIPPALTSDAPPVKLVDAKFENIKTEPGVAGQQQLNGGGCGKKFKTLSKVQCAECDEFLPNSDASRLHHTNVKSELLEI
uniref:C2H2-type domain-containing protein n=1 Tax=Globodera pallida TaxID=36090 RepID=A0A183CFY8_GLOPA